MTKARVGYDQYTDAWQANARLALDTIAMRPTVGIPCWMVNDMQWSHLEELSGNPPGSYEKEPVRVYREFQLAMGACYIDQWLATNPLSIKDEGYGEGAQHGATTGAEQVICDGIVIDSPEAVVEHMETRDGDGLFIIGGVSVTTTLPHGTPEAIRREMDWLVEKGPKVGLMLGCSSSVAPGVPIENMKALAEGFAHYRTKSDGRRS